MLDGIIILLAVVVGYLLRDGNIKRIEVKNKRVIEEIKKEKIGHGEFIDYKPQKSEIELANELLKK